MGYSVFTGSPMRPSQEPDPLFSPKFPLIEAHELFRFPPKSQDEKVVAERKWREGLRPAVAQKACDIGLFSDDANQKELF
jgi:hypothetical protein